MRYVMYSCRISINGCDIVKVVKTFGYIDENETELEQLL